MTKLILAVFLAVTAMSCGDDGPEPTCSEWVENLYGVENCAMYMLDTDPPTRLSMAETTIWCRQVVNDIHSQCSGCVGELNTWLRCTVDACIWSPEMQMFLATDCNDEFDRLLTCRC